MSNATEARRSRIVRSPMVLGVALVDVLLIAVFVVVGELNHGISVLSDPLRVAGTFAPFLIGWVLTSVLAGVYGPAAFGNWRTAAGLVGITWVGAALIGQLLRGTGLFHGELTVAFTIVSVLVGLVLLVPWRALAASRLDP
jgi:hypothetical protein